MLNKINYELIRTEKPFSKIIGCYELIVPLYNISIEVYVENEESLPPILDSVFSLYYLNYNVEEISCFLGTDQDVIKNSFHELIDMDFIDYISKKVTDKGRRYYIEKKVTNYDRKIINLVINKLTGEILSNESHSYSSRRDMLDLNGKTKYLENENVKIEEILTLKKVRKIWSERAVWDDKKYSGSILEIVNITEKDNVYLKEDIVYVLEDNKNVELLSFFRNKRDTELEKFLYANEFDDPKITTNDFSPFFKEFILEKTIKYFSSDKNELSEILNLDILKTAKSKVIICIPMIEVMTISEDLILSIKALAKKNIDIRIYISGWDFTSEHQRIQFKKLTSVLRKNVCIFSLNTFIPYTLIVDDALGFETRYVINEIEPKFKKIICVNFEYVEMSSQEIRNLLTILDSRGISSRQLPTLDGSINDTINRIIDNIYSIDELLTSEGYGWISETYPNIRDEDKLREFKQVKTIQELKDFLSICNVSLIESFRAKSQNPKDFENKFSKDHPDIFDVLNRIKVYRNFFMHGKLTPYNYNLFIKYIREDLEDYFLYGLDNLYEVLFLTTLFKLDICLEGTKERLLYK